METTEQPVNNNDLPLAKAFNTILLTIVDAVRKAKALNLPEDYEIGELNRTYVLLVNELENLYQHNQKLVEIRPQPFWIKFDVLKNQSWRILDYLDDPVNEKDEEHITRLEKLCIIANKETPEFSSEQLEFSRAAFKAILDYHEKLEGVRSDIAEISDDSWYIPKYWIDYGVDGTIMINGVLKLKKTHIDSAIDNLMEQAFNNHNELFTPKLPSTARNLSTMLSSAGFTPVLRQIFFPIADKRKGVLFRPTLTFEEATSDGIETTELDLLLKALGAELSFSA